MPSTAEDQARLLVSIEATQARFSKQLAKIAKDSGDTAAGIETRFKKANDNTARSFEGTSRRVTASFQAQRAAAQNLSFQLNDIATQLASGTSPLRVMAQQGGQVAQALQAAGGAGGAVRALGGAFSQLLNPIGLVSVALIGLTGYAIQYFAELLSSGKESEASLKEHAQLIESVVKKWGDALPSLQRYHEELQKAQEVTEVQQATDIGIDKAYEELRTTVADLRIDLEDLINTLTVLRQDPGKIVDLQNAFANLFDRVEQGNVTVDQLLAVQKALADQASLTGIPAVQKMAAAIGQMADELKRASQEGATFRREAAGIIGVTTQGGPARHNSLGITLPGSAPAPTRRVDPYFDDPISSSATSKASREVERAAKEAAEKLDKAVASQTSVAVDAVSTYLGQHERANRGNINAFLKAGGVDLDAATTAWCAAFVNSALAQVGVTGSGSNVATDFLNWGVKVDPSQIQRGDVLVDPNGKSAGQTGGHVGFATGLARFQEGVLQVQMLSGNASDQVQEDWVNATDVVARRATEAVELQAGALGHITEAAKEAAKQQEQAFKQAQQAAEQLGQAVGSALRGLVSAFADGKLEAEELLGIVMQLASQLLNMPGGPAGGGGFLGGLLGSIFHKGGVVGSSAPKRRVHPAAFVGAPRYHSGGVAGFRPGEVPAILQRGEVVLPRGTRMGGGQSVVINAPINAPGADAAALARVERSVKELGRNVPKMVDQRTDTRQTRKTRA